MLMHVTAQENLENFMLVGKKMQKAIYWIYIYINLYKMSRIGKSMETEIRFLIASDVRRRWGITSHGLQRVFFGWWNVLDLDSGDGYKTLWIEGEKNHWIIHFKREDFMACELYISMIKEKKPIN